MAWDLSALTAWTEEKANREMFMTKSVLGSKTAQYMRVLTGIKGTTKIPLLSADYDIFQSGTSCGFNASGNVDINQVTITPKKVKVNLQFCMQDFDTYFTRQLSAPGQMYDGLGQLESMVLNEIKRNIQKTMELALWQGNAGGASATTSFNIFTGINTLIAQNLATIPASQKLSGALTTGNIIASLQAMRDALPVDQFDEVYEASKYILFLAPERHVIYERDYRSTFTALPYNSQFAKEQLDGSLIEMVGVGGLFGVNGSINTKALLIKRDALWLAVDVEGEENELLVYMDEDKENVRVKARFSVGVGIQDYAEIVTNNY